VHPISFRRNNGEQAILSLGGRSWTVKHVDWDRQTAQVAPAEHGGRSRWLGGSQPLRFKLCQAVRRVLLGSTPCEFWSRRAATEIEEARHETTSVAEDALVIERDNSRDRTTWWTFAGLLGNAEVAGVLNHYQPYFDNFALTMSGRPDLRHIAVQDAHDAPRIPTSATNRVKFQECLPPAVLAAMQAERSSDHDAAAFVCGSPALWREHA
jgi:ATP-dependent Lhr-like helicase